MRSSSRGTSFSKFNTCSPLITLLMYAILAASSGSACCPASKTKEKQHACVVSLVVRVAHTSNGTLRLRLAHFGREISPASCQRKGNVRQIVGYPAGKPYQRRTAPSPLAAWCACLRQAFHQCYASSAPLNPKQQKNQVRYLCNSPSAALKEGSGLPDPRLEENKMHITSLDCSLSCLRRSTIQPCSYNVTCHFSRCLHACLLRIAHASTVSRHGG